MRYHAHMEFRVDGELAGKYHGAVGVIKAIDFSNWTIELELHRDGKRIITERRAVTLINHENCDAPCDCTANDDRTVDEP